MKLTTEQKELIERLIASGNKIEAIKQLRNIADVGLAEAKAVIDAMESGGHRPSAHEAAPRNLREAEQAALAAIRQGNVMEAIKRYHNHTRIGLKESKEAVDALSLSHRTEGRLNARAARAVIAHVAAGQKEEALTVLMSNAGYDDVEAKALIKTVGGLRVGGNSCGAGCLRMIVGLIVLLAVAWFVLGQAGLLAPAP